MSPYTCEPPSHPHTVTPSHLHPRQVDAPREQISDAVAVYFVMPTVDNVARICQDCRAQLYERYYLNFITAIPRPLLEEVAKATLEANSVAQIGKVYDQFLNFISLEDGFFILRNQTMDDISYYGSRECALCGCLMFDVLCSLSAQQT